MYICKYVQCIIIRISHRGQLYNCTHTSIYIPRGFIYTNYHYYYYYYNGTVLQVPVFCIYVLYMCMCVCVYMGAHNIIYKTSMPLGGFTSVHLSVCPSEYYTISLYLSLSLSIYHTHFFMSVWKRTCAISRGSARPVAHSPRAPRMTPTEPPQFIIRYSQ